ncbi:hypothetical protein JB92DRAFT_3104299 [Gautieria morchelliformis]|nr:hypothetical protein JB92DRAFT_3104299 [Gautieria morchelliformis]
MLSTLARISIFFTLAAHHVAAGLQVVTPTLTQCQNATISYSGGSGNYGLYVVPSNDPCADSVVNIPEQTGTSYTWKVNIPAGSQVELLVEDSTGAEAWSGVITVNNSSDSSCVDPSAARALAVGSSSISTTSASSWGSSSGSPTVPSTTALPYGSPGPLSASGNAKTITPATPSAVAKAAGSPNSGLPGAVLPPGFLLGVAAVLLAVVHL